MRSTRFPDSPKMRRLHTLWSYCWNRVKISTLFFRLPLFSALKIFTLRLRVSWIGLSRLLTLVVGVLVTVAQGVFRFASKVSWWLQIFRSWLYQMESLIIKRLRSSSLRISCTSCTACIRESWVFPMKLMESAVMAQTSQSLQVHLDWNLRETNNIPVEDAIQKFWRSSIV